MLFNTPIKISVLQAPPGWQPDAGNVFIYPKNDPSGVWLYMMGSDGIERPIGWRIGVTGGDGNKHLLPDAGLVLRGGNVTASYAGGEWSLDFDGYTKDEADAAIYAAAKIKASVALFSELAAAVPNPAENDAAIAGAGIYAYRGGAWGNLLGGFITMAEAQGGAFMSIEANSAAFFSPPVSPSKPTYSDIAYIAHRGDFARCGRCRLLFHAGIASLDETYQQTGEIGLTATMQTVGGLSSIRFYADSSNANPINIKVSASPINTLQI